MPGVTAYCGKVAKDIYYVGLDIRNAFDSANARNNYSFVTADVFSKAFEGERFDGLVSFDVAGYLQEGSRFLERCFEVVAGGGLFGVGLPISTA